MLSVLCFIEGILDYTACFFVAAFCSLLRKYLLKVLFIIYNHKVFPISSLRNRTKNFTNQITGCIEYQSVL